MHSFPITGNQSPASQFLAPAVVYAGFRAISRPYLLLFIPTQNSCVNDPHNAVFFPPYPSSRRGLSYAALKTAIDSLFLVILSFTIVF